MERLKDRQEYVDRYDHITVEDCRWRENFHLNYASSLKDKSKKEQDAIHQIGQVAWEIEKVLITLHWYNKKEGDIQKWMDEDERKDKRLENAQIPKNIFCDECYSRMEFSDKHLWDMDEKERVLFFFDCPKQCKKRKAIYDDGEQYIPKPHLCEKCKQEAEITREKLSDDQIQTTNTCSACGHEKVDVLDLSFSEEKEDLKYEYDRTRFCLSGEELHKAQEAKQNMDSMKELVDSWKEKEENKDLYDEVEQLNKLTVPQLKERVAEALSDKYSNIVFEKPDMGRIISIEFSVEEMSTENERDSVRKLKKLLQGLLQDTNWRLMTEGISYRLGVLTGRLRVYESEEDLVKLMEKKRT